MQKISLEHDALAGPTLIPKGDYVVQLATDIQMITLSGPGKEYRVPAVKRRSSVRGKGTQVSFRSGGGPVWSIIVSVPKYGEWIGMIEYQISAKHGEK
jgi:hypothetical protein